MPKISPPELKRFMDKKLSSKCGTLLLMCLSCFTCCSGVAGRGLTVSAVVVLDYLSQLPLTQTGTSPESSADSTSS